MSKYLNKSFFVNLFIILSIFGLDRFTKIYVISENEKNLSSELFVSKYLNINLIYNDGIAFGLLSFDDKLTLNVSKQYTKNKADFDFFSDAKELE